MDRLMRLYMAQKVQSKETFSDNAMDTQQYWSEVTMPGDVDESVPYCERLKSYTSQVRRGILTWMSCFP